MNTLLKQVVVVATILLPSLALATEPVAPTLPSSITVINNTNKSEISGNIYCGGNVKASGNSFYLNPGVERDYNTVSGLNELLQVAGCLSPQGKLTSSAVVQVTVKQDSQPAPTNTCTLPLTTNKALKVTISNSGNGISCVAH